MLFKTSLPPDRPSLTLARLHVLQQNSACGCPDRANLLGAIITSSVWQNLCSGFVKDFVRPLFNEELERVGNVEVQVKSKVLVSEIEEISAKRNKLLSDVRRQLSLTWSCTAHVTTLLSTRFKESLLYKMGKNFLLSEWSEKQGRRFYTMDVDICFSVGCERVREALGSRFFDIGSVVSVIWPKVCLDVVW